MWSYHGLYQPDILLRAYNVKAPRKNPRGFQNRWHCGQKPRLKKRSTPPAEMQAFSLTKRCLLQNGAGYQDLRVLVSAD